MIVGVDYVGHFLSLFGGSDVIVFQAVGIFVTSELGDVNWMDIILK